jgi:RNA polymerase sigma-70 factor, ECF subfamily
MVPTEFDDPGFLARLRQGDSAAYRILVRRFHASLVRFAASIIGSHAQAEEVVQDAWLAVYSGVGRFEGRSSLVTWIFSIVVNRARTRVSREGRHVGLDSLMEGTSATERGVPLTEFKPDGHWVEAPRLWDELNPERIVVGRQLWDHVQGVIDLLPTGQRAVILLRDMEGRDAEETCSLLDISPENQRVLLHRARSRIRREIDTLIGVDPMRIAPGRTASTKHGPAKVRLAKGRLSRVFRGLANLLTPTGSILAAVQ